MARMIRFSMIAALLTFAMAGRAFASTHYVAANGSDSNNGTSESTPWLHAPGMPSCSATCASYTPQAGDQIILRGGDTWHRSSGSPSLGGTWTFNWSGSNGNPIYVGVDTGWFAGGSFARPVINMDNPLSTGFPSGCSFDDTNLNAMSLSANYVTLDNFEWLGNCINGGASTGMLVTNGHDLIISNHYFHGWTLSTHATDDSYKEILASDPTPNDVFTGNVFDGSDSSAGAVCTNTSCVASAWNGSGTPNPIPATGWAIAGTCFNVNKSVIRHMSNGLQCNMTIVHDNLFEYMFEPGYGRHGNTIESFGGSSGTMYFYNNVVRNINEGINVQAQGNESYYFNNIFENDQHFPPDPNCVMLAPNGASNVGVVTTIFMVNDTFDNTCAIDAYGGNGNTPHWALGSTITWMNNHIIGRTSINGGLFVCQSGSSCTVVDSGSEVFQTLSAANSQGYTLSNDFSPTASGGATVGQGLNDAASCAIFSSDSALCSGTSDGASEQSGEAGYWADFPAIPMVSRLTSWDVGAHEFGSSSSGQPNPPSALSATVQ